MLGDGEMVALEITGVIRDFKAEGSPGGREQLLLRLAQTGGVYVPAFYDVEYLDDGRIKRVVPNRPGVPWRVSKHTVTDLDAWPYPKKPLVPLAESVHERASVEIFRGCTRGCRFCQAGMITRPVRERSITGIGEMVEQALNATGFEEVGLLSLSSADHSEIKDVAKGLADRYEGTNTSLSLPSTRVDAFNIDLANELTRGGRRSGLTFAPEGGSERIRKVINKMVTEEDLIRTVATAYGNGWRQVKLYFMCGLPTETDDDVLQIAALAREVIKTGREVSGRKDIRCTVSIGGFVPKPHTPFQWAAQLDAETTDARLRKLRNALRDDRQYGKAIGFRYHDGEPGIVEGLLSRGDRRVGRVIETVWRDGGRFDGWSEHFSFERWMQAATHALSGRAGRRRLVHHPRAGLRRGAAVGPPRLRPRQGLALGGLAGRAGRGRGRGLPVDPVLRLRRLPADGHRHRDRPHRQAAAPAHRRGRRRRGPARLMARQPPARDTAPPVQKLRVRYAKRGRLRFTSHRDIQRALERALRRAGVPMAYSSGFTPHPKISYAGAAAMGAASEAEYLEISVTERLDPERVRLALDAALPPGSGRRRGRRGRARDARRPARGVRVADRASGRRRRSGG